MKIIPFGSVKGNKIVPAKLKEARVSRNLSLAQLSKLVGVSSQTISLYEKGEISPSPGVLIKLIEELDFPIKFFCTEEECNLEEEVIFFRSNKNIPKKIKEACKIRTSWIDRTYKLISSYFDLPKVDIPDFGDITFDNIDEIKIEEITTELRLYWGLGESPISNLVGLLQQKGFIITRLEIGTKKIDAFSKWMDKIPYIFLGNDKNSAARSRFDLAHELGHIILHKNIDKEEFESNINLIEQQADRFAAAFLLPLEAFNREVISSSIDSFILLKKKWKVSISAMIRRCQTANILTDNQIRYLNSQMIKHGYYKREPLDDIMISEKPYLFKQAFDILVENNIFTKEVLLDEIKLNREEAVSLYSLDKSFFDKSNDLLKLIKI
ncbi:transcriptional regulator [Clostridioides difficile]|uniref:helix-turn-helix domain-containing protein n=1 Tax=Clostridioides difficile TaxID=1496 RepID=UPI0010B4A9C3|nr:XRE family transcriptional regulator [Clostridioides difficile]MCK3712618.1 XRE family transcriptional regulator [Clostridioides difficile]VHX79579.1 transcriptional regulator [Clostridioides difficile]